MCTITHTHMYINTGISRKSFSQDQGLKPQIESKHSKILTNRRYCAELTFFLTLKVNITCINTSLGYYTYF